MHCRSSAIALAKIPRRINFLSGICALAVVAVMDARAPLSAETLADAAAATVATNPSRQASRADVNAAADGVDQAAAGYRPTVALVSQYGWLDQKLRTPIASTDTFAHPRGYGVQFTQNLWNGFKTKNTVQRETETYKATVHQMRDADQALLLEVAKVYVEVLRAQLSINLYRSSREFQNYHLREVNARVATGLATTADVDQVRAAQAKSVSDDILAQSRLRVARARYAQIVGREPGKLSMPKVPRNRLPHSLQPALAAALEQNAALQAARHNVSAAKANIAVARADYAPTVDFQAQATMDYEPIANPTFRDVRNYGGMVKVNFPIYEGGLTTANVQRAFNISEKQQLSLDYQQMTLRSSVTAAWDQYRTGKDVIAAARAQVSSATKALQSIEEGAAVGERSTLEVNTARSTLLDARLALVNAQCNEVVDAYNLLYVMGTLDETVLHGDGADAAWAAEVTSSEVSQVAVAVGRWRVDVEPNSPRRKR